MDACYVFSIQRRSPMVQKATSAPRGVQSVLLTWLRSFSRCLQATARIKKQFRDQWRHQTAIPKVAKIWKIYGSQDAHNDFVQYRHTVARKSGIPSGNARRRWHGTVRACRLGDTDQHDQLCSMSACALCSIIHDSFSVAHVGVRTSWSRFGHGLYFTATSSKANDYASGPAQSRYKAMLLNDVVLGQTYKVVGDNPSLTNPPYGYDSVLGEPGFGNLNYDECVVYTPSAVRTSFLVIYEP
ncbi:ADP-ribosylation [Artomyces pyxidatus]|uniref:ADP-ribosylation n=1 Tax=Artomyces pyxidatus TaxID=48021 RepID=A0ACB8SKE0_9AGAM|nr:ADP-ribosylation [Artomyces pyxidatus]